MSALLDGEIDCWASPAMVRLPLVAGSPVRLRYLGDHMWPAFAHGQSIEVVPLGSEISPGDAVVALTAGQVELWRVSRATAEGVWVCGDADVDPPARLARTDALGAVRTARIEPGWLQRRGRRAWLECLEAWTTGFAQSAETVRDKYDMQAEGYAMHGLRDPAPEWCEAIRRHLGDRGRILVVGSGVGRECHALARMGFTCLGLDFSAKMIAAAERLARDAALDGVRFRQGDIRSFDLAPGSLDGVLFTHDVYSFLPRARERIAVLRRIAAGLSGRGRLLLSARVIRGRWSRAVLALQWLRSVGRHELGDSHTRFLSPDGTVHRSFVHCFTARSLRREYTAAAFDAVARERSFLVLEPRRN
jgi:SAM-dependent methyltransferase